MRYVISPQVHYKSLDGEIVILDGRGDQYLGLNKSGALIWNVIVDGGSRDEAVQAVMDAYDVSRERSSEDVHRLVDELVKTGLLRPLAQ